MRDAVFADVAKNNSFGLALLWRAQGSFRILRILIALDSKALEPEISLSGAESARSCVESSEVLRKIMGVLRGEAAEDILRLLDKSSVKPFSAKALECLRKSVPRGSLISYGQLAKLCGRPKAARALGMAMASNPFPIVFPCHRVLGADGRLVGFGGGIPLKRRLLELEGIRFDKDRALPEFFIK